MGAVMQGLRVGSEYAVRPTDGRPAQAVLPMMVPNDLCHPELCLWNGKTLPVESTAREALQCSFTQAMYKLQCLRRNLQRNAYHSPAYRDTGTMELIPPVAGRLP